MIRVRAPGKALLAGEYAVLLPGRAALVAAVDRHLEVRAWPAEKMQAQAGKHRWEEGETPPAELAFVAEALSEVGRRWPDAGRWRLDSSSALGEGEEKLGLGGSAAATVAAIWAAGAKTGADVQTLWALADGVHRKVQGGRGSGADIAAAVHGGVIRYERPLRARPLPVHEGLRFFLVWSGRSARTAPRVAAFERFAARHPEEAEAFGARSDEAVANLEQGLASGEIEAVRRGMEQARAALHLAAEGMGIELETPALRAIVERARAVGAAGKLSGAGGGDGALIVAEAGVQEEALRETLRAGGWAPIGLELAGGVCVEGG